MPSTSTALPCSWERIPIWWTPSCTEKLISHSDTPGAAAGDAGTPRQHRHHPCHRLDIVSLQPAGTVPSWRPGGLPRHSGLYNKTTRRDTHDALLCAIELRLLPECPLTADVPDVISSLPGAGTARARALSAAKVRILKAEAVSIPPDVDLEVVRGPSIEAMFCGRMYKPAMDTLVAVTQHN